MAIHIVCYIILNALTMAVITSTKNSNKNNLGLLPEFRVSNAEILEFVDSLRSLDENKAKPSQIQIDYQGHTSTRDLQDNAKTKFFTKIDESLLRRPTYKKLILLHDNYIFETGTTEINTNQEKIEIKEFLDAIFNTRLFKFFRDFLKEKDFVLADSETTLHKWVYQLWFGQYSRARGVKDTCGFEHVFLGEAKNGEISGMHNWLRFYLLEKNSTANQFDYKGFLVKRFNVFGALKYSWGEYVKRSGSFLIGTSPEFDLTLYTFCFFARRGHSSPCDIEFDGCPISITSFNLVQQNQTFIGSMYPSAGRITEKCRQKASNNN